MIRHGLTDPILSSKFRTNVSNVIPERQSENIQSSNASESQEFNPKMNTLFVPKVANETEGRRKRVLSFKKNHSEQPPSRDHRSPSINEVDEYLDISDEDMNEESIEKFIQKTNESQKLQNDSLADLLDDSDEGGDLKRYKSKGKEETKEHPRLKMKKSRQSEEMDYNEELINSALRIKKKPGSKPSLTKPPPFT